MKIKQFRYGNEGNLGYLLWSGREAVAVDGVAPDEITAFAEAEGLEVKYVTNTHEHRDHIHGNEDLLTRTDAVNITPDIMCSIKVLKIGSEQLEAFPAPGHSEESIVFYFNDDNAESQGNGSLLTGDTLFNGTVGNCYTKDYELYFESLQKVLRFPPETRIYAGHDIFDYTTGVIQRIDPDNPYLNQYKASYVRELLSTTIAQELRVNPFIRWDDPSLDTYRASLGMPHSTPYERFRAMMSVH
ncbi:MAG: MBL fold metallo-hydrolase [Spirochaetales bacterium]|uniref:MBL fold metallo-hydrolase n=1 Tax=Candidatus Thalassospirochaeta sargassi TaxID=3119039 RepID=A0AAJ1IFX6_9SPIO|nr:MBL fold metallo-hydrolase [Spirochaetales bacterium]